MKQVRLAEDTEVGREEPPHVLFKYSAEVLLEPPPLEEPTPLEEPPSAQVSAVGELQPSVLHRER
jgi:hypothetical protein